MKGDARGGGVKSASWEPSRSAVRADVSESTGDELAGRSSAKSVLEATAAAAGAIFGEFGLVGPALEGVGSDDVDTLLTSSMCCCTLIRLRSGTLRRRGGEAEGVGGNGGWVLPEEDATAGLAYRALGWGDGVEEGSGASEAARGGLEASALEAGLSVATRAGLEGSLVGGDDPDDSSFASCSGMPRRGGAIRMQFCELWTSADES